MSLLDKAQAIKGSFDDASQSLKTTNLRNWSTTHEPASATKATITKAAVSGYKHVCTGIIATVACSGAAQTPINVRLRDGATGAGTVLAAFSVSAPVNGVGGIALTNIYIPGTTNTAMTLEFSAAGVTDSVQAVTLIGHDIVG